jgi:hypothetical protein
MAFLKLLRKQIDAGIAPVCFGVNAIAHQKQEGFDDDLLLGICTAIIVAGGESTASMMQSFIKLMALHPEVQQKAQEGIKYTPIVVRLSDQLTIRYRTRPSRRTFSPTNLGRPPKPPIHQGHH